MERLFYPQINSSQFPIRRRESSTARWVTFDDHAVYHMTLDVLAAAVTKGTVQRV
jgi:hypothetical protein